MLPLIIFPGQQQLRKMSGIEKFPEVLYDVMPSGWMDTKSFQRFLVSFNKSLDHHLMLCPVILFIDGYTAHVMREAAVFCSENGIILHTLLSHATFLLQPWDVTIFSQVKTAWSMAVNKWMHVNKGEVLKKSHFPGIFHEACQELKL